MDFQIQYNGETSIYNTISTYEELIQEILQKYQTIQEIELSYQDEEGDIIQVSNTSDLYAINEPDKITIQMKARQDEQKQQELEKEKKRQEIKLKKIKEQQQKKQNAIDNEELTIANLEKEIASKLKENQDEILYLKSEQQRLEHYKPDPLPDFEVSLNEARLFDRIKEKEDQLLYIEDKKGFETQLRTVQKEIHDIFHQIYEERKNQHSENYKKWNQTKQSLAKVGHQIELKEQEAKKYSETSCSKLQNHREKLQKLRGELDKIEDETE
ncbi:unnamed protein product (macronuclear) [Paramecium tetraurelia]|uniref:PB1 domain-containing protein n=1 Tax=Paramecium tetraurelia TaxID=5888 RepID=A0BRF2_PARTE|nr:uncharacterized protein GSPATT00031350001 [Paramecium tetraurelia]CAK61119.1 unnamed protein product [Paramecium tetraurelia]|eukprot:XP_001428517.1 hypothetical protein (macronuclear) [Paramecium tetraurelia strain d4-2]